MSAVGRANGGMTGNEKDPRRRVERQAVVAEASLHAGRTSAGMRYLRWAAADSLQVGLFATLALSPLLPADWTWLLLLRMSPVPLMAAVIYNVIRRSFMDNVFALETPGSPMRRSLAATCITFLAIGAFSTPWLEDARPHLRWLLVCATPSMLLSAGIGAMLGRWWSAPRTGLARVAVIGEPNHAGRVMAALRGGRWTGWSGTLQLDDTVPSDILRMHHELAEGRVDVVIIAAAGSAERVRNLIYELQDATERLCLALDVPHQIHGVDSVWLVNLWRSPHDSVAGAMKRVIDLAGSLIGLLFLAPLLLVVALLIKLESPGPVLFRQWRFGVRSQPFNIMKFRTMRDDLSDPSGANRTLAVDPRVTRVGRVLRRTSIDELPQLWNVLLGQMSLVGPRAQAMRMTVEGQLMYHAMEDYRARHRVLPGITGWAQINGSRGEVDTLAKAVRRTELDRWYIEHWSLGLDIWILLRTVLGGFITFRAD